MYRIEWIKDGKTYYGVEIEDLDRAYYLAQSMTDLTGVTHSVCEEDVLKNCIQVCYGCGCFYNPQEKEVELIDDQWLCVGCQPDDEE